MENQQTIKNKDTIRGLYENILNNRKIELLNDLISSDYIGIRGEKGANAFTETVNAVIAAFPDVKWTIEDIIAEGDKVMVRWSWVGTNTSPFRGIPATNQKTVDSAIAIYRFSEDKIEQAWIQGDRLGMLMQLGVVPKDVLSFSQTKK
ncbi:MAG: ester cyclase [Bacteroidia bacterium]